MAPLSVRLLPDPDQHDLLAETLERVNKASNLARTRAIEQSVSGRAALRAVVKEELDKFKLPAAFVAPALQRVEASLTRQKFGTYQSLVLPPAAVKWPASDRVTLPTAAGKRTVRVYMDPMRGGLRPPLEGVPAALVFRNGEFDLVDASLRRVSRLLLVRHGQSTWNADGRWQGRADPPLSELGVRQAEAVAAALGPDGAAAYEITGLWTSPLERARRTAEIVGELIGLPLAVETRLEERDAGEWTGLTRVEIEAAWPGYLAEYRRPPGFELDETLVVRALAALDEIAAMVAEVGSGPGLVITHAGVIRGVERHLGGESEPVPNLGGRELVRGAGGLELGDRLLLVDPDAVEVTTPRQI